MVIARPAYSHKEDRYNLGQWGGMLRSFPERLTTDQIARLEALLGWAWTINARRCIT